MSAFPPWIRGKLPGRGQYYDVRQQLGRGGLHTVCEEARCPNLATCWGGGTATFMIAGKICTRGCRFCDVTSGRPPAPPDSREPEQVAAAAAQMGLKYIVVTSVDRDDLDDQGSQHFVDVVAALERRLPVATIELLTPDFRGDRDAIRRVGRSGAEVLGHNIETVRRLTPKVRDRRCGYDLSLSVLAAYRELGAPFVVKSSLMLGLGERLDEVVETLRELRGVGVDWVTLGQYLRPSRKHLAVERFVEPAEFDGLAETATAMGFPLVSAGPLVRSSYRAGERGAQQLIAQRAGSVGTERASDRSATCSAPTRG